MIANLGHSGQYARDVLEGWHVTLVVEGDAGYQMLFGKRLEVVDTGC